MSDEERGRQAAQRPMRRANRRLRPALDMLEERQLLAVNVIVDYSLDTGGFFTTTRRQTIETVFHQIADNLNNTLAAVGTSNYSIPIGDGSTTRTVTTSVPANTIKIYVMGTSTALTGDSVALSSVFATANSSTHKYRGEPVTEYAPDLGSIRFDNSGTTKWYFGETSPAATDGYDFVTAARREFMHIVAINSNSVFESKHSGNEFVGTNAVAAIGKPVPLSTNGAFVASSVPSVLNSMTPGVRRKMNSLEYAMLKDVGWEVRNGAPDDIYRRALLDHGAEGHATLVVHPGWGVSALTISALQGDHLILSTRNGSAANQQGVDTYVQIFDLSGNVLAFNDDSNATTKSSLDYTFQSGGVYAIVATTYRFRNFFSTPSSLDLPETTNQFLLDATLTRFPNFEPDRAYLVNSYLSPTVAGTSLVSTINAGDGDFYGINAKAGVTYRVTTSIAGNLGYPGGAIATVYDATGRKVTTIVGTPLYPAYPFYGSVQFTATTSGRYYVDIETTAGPNQIPMSADDDNVSNDGWITVTPDGDYSAGGTYDGGADYAVKIARASATSDFDGDGKTDPVIFRPSTDLWVVNYSSGGKLLTNFGDTSQGDIPVPGDFDGDGKTDLALFRPKTDTWIIQPSSGGPVITRQFGDPANGDIPIPGDYEGNGTYDLALFRTKTEQWIIRMADGSTVIKQFGDPAHNDLPVPGDFDGDGKTDLALFRPDSGQWIVRHAAGDTAISQFGDPAHGDYAAPGDYDGDGKIDFAIFRPGTALFVIQYTSGGKLLTQLGDPANGDLPVTAPLASLGLIKPRALHASSAPQVTVAASSATFDVPSVSVAIVPVVTESSSETLSTFESTTTKRRQLRAN